MKVDDALIALFCYKKMNCSDHPIVVTVGKDGSTNEVIDEPYINTVDDLNAYDDYKYNGIVTYALTVSPGEYHNRFEHLAKVRRGKGW